MQEKVLLRGVELDSIRTNTSLWRFAHQPERREWRRQWWISTPKECAEKRPFSFVRAENRFTSAATNINMYSASLYEEKYARTDGNMAINAVFVTIETELRTSKAWCQLPKRLDPLPPSQGQTNERTDVTRRQSERTLINVTIFEGIGTQLENIVDQRTNRDPRKNLWERKEFFPSTKEKSYRRKQRNVTELFENGQVIVVRALRAEKGRQTEKSPVSHVLRRSASMFSPVWPHQWVWRLVIHVELIVSFSTV